MSNKCPHSVIDVALYYCFVKLETCLIAWSQSGNENRFIVRHVINHSIIQLLYKDKQTCIYFYEVWIDWFVIVLTGVYMWFPASLPLNTEGCES